MLKDTHSGPPPTVSTSSNFLHLSQKLNASQHLHENTENGHKTHTSLRSVLADNVDTLNPFSNYKVTQTRS